MSNRLSTYCSAEVPLRRLVSAAIAALIALSLTLTAVSVAHAKTPPPPRTLANTKIDAHLGYMPQSKCSPSAKPGAKALLNLLIKTWGGSSSGISRSCGTGGRSEHKEGRALDWHMSVKKASQRKRVASATKWITANNGEVARRLGIMYMLWNQKIWSTYYPELGWRKMENRGSPTSNHKDHVHISLSWDGAYKQTSWWTGRPVTEPLNSKCGTSSTHACLPTISRSSRKWPYQKTTVPASFTPAPWVIPAVGGSPQVGRTLRAVPGTWVPTGASITYQWLSDGKAISGATEATYLIGADQVGRDVEVRVTARSGNTVTSKKSKNVAEVYPGRMNSPAPKVTGTLAPGSTLSVNLGVWKPAASRVSYVWLRDGKKIKGATAATFKLRAKDRGHKISVRVRASRKGYYTRTLTSSKHKVLRAFTTRSVPTISGASTMDSALTTRVGLWRPSPNSISYQWYADGKAISEATRAAFTSTSAQVGKVLQVRITVRKAGYATVWVRSARFGPVISAGTTSPTPSR